MFPQIIKAARLACDHFSSRGHITPSENGLAQIHPAYFHLCIELIKNQPIWTVCNTQYDTK